MATIFSIFLSALLLFASGKYVEALQNTMETCCLLGDGWAERHTVCKGYPFPFHGVAKEDQDLCRWSLEICCLRRRRSGFCEKGKEAARSSYNKECAAVSAIGGESFKDCCEGCKLGLTVAKRKSTCFFSGFSFSAPWDEAFYSCCYQEKEGRSTTTDRCLTASPCEQNCVDTGGPDGMTCSCEPGYRLSRNRFSCDDIDECAEKSHTCNPLDENCLNSPGGFHCIQSEEPHPCQVGYVYNATVGTCDDVDECSLGSHSCIRGSQTCQNTIGSFTCRGHIKCPPGFKESTASSGCDDIDECEEDLHGCNLDREICLNSYGAYHCQDKKSITECPAGYKWDQQKCQDVDECAEKRHACQDTEQCSNTAGGYNCIPTCAKGLYFSSSQKRCVDVDECLESVCGNGENCINTLGSFHCIPNQLNRPASCSAGYKNENGRCVDIDECREGEESHSCLASEICRNYEGGYRCLVRPRQACPAGHSYSPTTERCEDLNECQVGRHDCDSTQRCDNTIGSFICVRVIDCGTGYTLNAESGKCEDDDECALQLNICGADYICRNTDGSFRCDRTACGPDERLLNDGLCHPAECGQGMQLDEQGRCQDVNECNESPCRSNQRCVNTPGSFRCQNAILCGGGFEPNQQGTQCVDVDECQRNSHECGNNQICRNRPGGYSCECPEGYSLNAHRSCEDVDECTKFRDRVCSINSDCQNTPGSYICNCKTGFKKTTTGQNCADVDECEEARNLCQHECVNTWGSYACTCKPGFNLAADNRSCQDIDECDLYKDKGSLCSGFCVNNPGSFSCSCPDGYRLGTDARTCQDINECQEQEICQGENQLCLNTRGGYKCNNISCPAGYTREKAHRSRCKRTNLECKRGDQDCLKDPISISFNYLTMASKMRIPASGQLDLFTMRGPRFSFTNVHFSLEMRDARAPGGVDAAIRENFHIRRTAFNEAMVSMVKSLTGPQEIELELLMKMYHDGQFQGNAVAKLFIHISRYDF